MLDKRHSGAKKITGMLKIFPVSGELMDQTLKYETINAYHFTKNNLKTCQFVKSSEQSATEISVSLNVNCSLRHMQWHAHVQALMQVSLHVQFITCAKS